MGRVSNLGCFSDGETIDEALHHAQEALTLRCVDELERGHVLPPVPDIRQIDKPDNGFVTLVETDLTAKSKSVKKTLTISSWLNDLAVEHNVNFSNVLQNALFTELGVGQ